MTTDSHTDFLAKEKATYIATPLILLWNPVPVITGSTASKTKTQITTTCRYTDKQIIAVLAIRNRASQTFLAEAALLIEVTENKKINHCFQRIVHPQ